MKKLLLILGNGFSIDFIHQIQKTEKVDVCNLFRLGHTVRFPYAGPGFLSYRYCPSLWILGARPNMSTQDCMSIIEEIITCSNMFFEYLEVPEQKLQRMKLMETDNLSVYIKAYFELIAYLRSLFIEYNLQITDDEINNFVEKSKWGWLEYIKKVCQCNGYDKISIITYNYDIWLERVLNSLGIEYSICGFNSGTTSRVEIIKPHGSISFVPSFSQKNFYSINYQLDSNDNGIEQIEIAYADLEQYDKNYLIPPAGDSSRRKNETWAAKLRECALDSIKNLSDDDDAIICGMSYWHVDRRELDELLINLNTNVNLSLINPNPPKELNAVLVSLFSKYTAFTSSETLKGAIK